MRNAGERIRVLVVDDSTFVRQAISRMLSSEPDIEVVGQAQDGLEGVELARTLEPDVITLDVKMPRMDGLEALTRLMAERPVPVLLLSSLTAEGADTTLRGLELGALDFIDKSRAQGQMNFLSLAQELRAKIRVLAGAELHGSERRIAARGPVVPTGRAAHAEVVAIGASTGGPSALQAIVPRLPSDFGAAVLIVQHIPAGFTQSLAERLASRSALPVREAKEGEIITPGAVLLGPAGVHLKLRRRGSIVRVHLDDVPHDSLHRPSVDVLFESVARAFGPRGVGVILTGMGQDGAAGLLALRRAGGFTLAESQETAVIYGMPRAAVEAGGVERSVPLDRMADEILGAV